MKWIEFKNKVETLGYDDDTDIRFFVTTYDGDSFELSVERVEDMDRSGGHGNMIDIELSDPPKEYMDYFNDSYVDEMIEELNAVISKYQ